MSAFTHYVSDNTPLAVNHQGQFPSVTISFNLPVGISLSEAVPLIEDAERDIGVPSNITGSFAGTAQAFQESLASEPLLILAAIVTVYIVLGMLYEDLIHPVTILSTLPSAGVGALLALLVTHYELNVISLIGIILLIGIVKKNAIMMIDFAIPAERRDGLTPEAAIFRACVLRFRPITMTTMAALAGRFAGRAGPRRRLGAAPAAGNGHRGRPDLQPASDAVHHAGGLSVSQSVPAAAGGPARKVRRGSDHRSRRRLSSSRSDTNHTCSPRFASITKSRNAGLSSIRTEIRRRSRPASGTSRISGGSRRRSTASRSPRNCAPSTAHSMLRTP